MIDVTGIETKVAKGGPLVDERFWMHRYKATSHAAVVGGVLMGGWFLWEHLANQRLRWDIAVIMGAMAVTKLAVLAWYRFRD